MALLWLLVCHAVGLSCALVCHAHMSVMPTCLSCPHVCHAHMSVMPTCLSCPLVCHGLWSVTPAGRLWPQTCYGLGILSALVVAGTFSDGDLLLATDATVLSSGGTTNVTFEPDFIPGVKCLDDEFGTGGRPETLTTGSGASKFLLPLDGDIGGCSLLVWVLRCDPAFVMVAVDGTFWLPLIDGTFWLPLIDGSFWLPLIDGTFWLPLIDGSFWLPLIDGTFWLPLIDGSLWLPVLDGDINPWPCLPLLDGVRGDCFMVLTVGFRVVFR